MLDPARMDDVLRRGGDVATAVAAWKGLDERRRKLQGDLDTLRQQRNAANERMAKLEAEKSQISSDLADETVYQIGRIYDLAQESAARIRRDGELSAAALAEDANRRVRAALAHAAGRLARDLVTNSFQASDQTRLVQGFVEKLSEEAGR